MKKTTIIFIVTLIAISARAQHVTKSCIVNYTKSYFTDSRDYFVAPFKWNAKQAALYGGILAAGVGVYFADDWIHEQVKTPNSSQQDGINYGLSYFGNGYYTMPLMAGMFLYGLSTKKELPFQTALMGVKSFVISTVLTRAIKYSFNRSRPNENQGSQFWGGPFNPFSLSFPSGHTTGAFAVASVLARNYTDHKWVPITSYALAAGVGLSRIWTKNHWASDVVFGALIGWSVGTILTKVECNKKQTSLKVEGNGLAWKF
jgi:membrane-associated phospholipid phosphatase